MATAMTLNRPELAVMAKELVAAAYVVPPVDEAHRATIEALYYLLLAANPCMETLEEEKRCFGACVDNPLCIGDATHKTCLLVHMCKEMKRLQDAIKAGTTTGLNVNFTDAEKKTMQLCMAELNGKGEKKMDGNAIPMSDTTQLVSTVPDVPAKVTKKRHYNPALLDAFGFRLSSFRSKVIALIAAGGEKSAIVSQTRMLKPELTDKAAAQWVNQVISALRKGGHTVTVTDGMVTFIQKS